MVLLHADTILLARVEAAVPVESYVALDCVIRADFFEQSVSPVCVCVNSKSDLPLGEGITTGCSFLGFYTRSS
jgi:hypothetical protein